MSLFTQSLVTALEIVFIWTLFRPGMILARIGDLFETSFPEWLKKPLYDCPVCMVSFWGTAFYLIEWNHLFDFYLNEYAAFIFTTGGILVLISGWLNYLDEESL